MSDHEHSLRRLAWACFLFGVAASGAGNWIGAPPTVIGHGVALFIVGAVIVAGVLIEQIPMGDGGLVAWIRLAGAGWCVAAAGLASYTHCATVAEKAGLSGVPKVMLATAPDAVILVAGLSLRHLRRLDRSTAHVAMVVESAPAVPHNDVRPARAATPNELGSPTPEPQRTAPDRWELAAAMQADDHSGPRNDRPGPETLIPAPVEPVGAPVPVLVPAVAPEPVDTLETAPVAADGPVGRDARMSRVRELRAQGITRAEIATELGVSEKTIGRDLRDLGLTDPTPGAPSSNGHHPDPIGA